MSRADYESVVVQFCFNRKTGESDWVSLRMPRLRWSWDVNRKSFEVLHGMSRVVKLIPDKLATARVIGFEEQGDHNFLFQLVIDLIENTYLELNEKNWVARVPTDSADHQLSLTTLLCGYPDLPLLDLPRRAQQKTLHQCITNLSLQLKAAQNAATLEQFDRSCRRILETADGILSGCQAYLQFVHPIMCYVRRLQEFDDTLANNRILHLSDSYESQKAYKKTYLTEEHARLNQSAFYPGSPE